MNLFTVLSANGRLAFYLKAFLLSYISLQSLRKETYSLRHEIAPKLLHWTERSFYHRDFPRGRLHWEESAPILQKPLQKMRSYYELISLRFQWFLFMLLLVNDAHSWCVFNNGGVFCPWRDAIHFTNNYFTLCEEHPLLTEPWIVD